MAGARWVQKEILDAHPGVKVRVYAISFRMLPSDRVAEWLVDPYDLLSDPRVDHFWDEDRVIGRWYAGREDERSEGSGDRVEWDAYFLYDPDATWDDSPPEPVSWGRTIVQTREKLRRDFDRLSNQLGQEGAS